MTKTKTIRMSDNSRSDDFQPYREGHVDVTVSVPVERFKEAYDELKEAGAFEQSIVEAEGWSEDDLRVGLAVLTTVMDDLPMLTTDFTKLVMATGCSSTVCDVVAREFGLVEREAA